MDWNSIYQSRVTSAEEAVKAIKSGNRVFMTGNVSVPQRLLAALVAYAPKLKDVEICQALSVGPADYVKPEMEGHLRVNSLFISDNVRKTVQEGRADFTPVLLSEFPLLFKNKVLPLDAAMIHVSPPDEHGFCSLGVEVGLSKSPAESAKIIIAEVNEQMPRTLGDSFIHVSRLNHIVLVNYPIPEMPMASDNIDPVIEHMAGYVADLVPDGATMQMGIGMIPDTVLKFLFHKKDLGVHSEMISDGVIDLVEAGVLNGARKTLHPGKIVLGFVLGSQRLYHWVNENPLCEFRRTEYVNDPFVIAQNERMVAINSAIEVDLTGQVCADSIGPKFFSGVGGQLDFVYGASRAKDGVAIIAMSSTSKMKDGKVVSKIVPMLKLGAGVVTTRNHVHFIVTEYGVADLYGKSVRQRVKALVNIAHPDFRADLEKQARDLCWAC
ncbi:MAG: acetyl-CoA hydrolase/transferase C-terminal domain-containing protein [Anaerolineales bacterium]|jgi:acetyl-CoA hydrolase